MSSLNGNVIRILSDTKVMINLGSNQGAHYGESFEIYEPGEEITDPTSKKDLGRFDFIKATVEITDIFKNFSIAQHITETEETRSTGGFTAFQTNTKKVTVKTIHKLNINKNQIHGQKVDNPNISVGDLVRSIY